MLPVFTFTITDADLYKAGHIPFRGLIHAAFRLSGI
jgi:hypothetical protein